MGDLKNYIWYEKYRPKNFGDMVLKRDHRELFEAYVEKKDIPHLLFYGTNGSGKTTSAFILMEAIPCVRLVLNASSEDRGIATIKGKVKQFAASEAIGGKLKIVFLDEGDKLTKDAQDALRNMMETYSGRCRFIITGNYIDRVQEAIKSRCTLFKFDVFHKKRLSRHLQSILRAEGVRFDEGVLSSLMERHYPDIRSIINLMQAASVGGQLQDVEVNKQVDGAGLVALIKKGALNELRAVLASVNEYTWIYKCLSDFIIADEDLGREEKVAGIQIVAEYAWKDASVLIREINFVACAMELMGVFGCKKISF